MLASPFDAQLNWMRGLGKREMVALWGLCDGKLVQLEDLHGADGEIIIHEGQNSLPLFSTFQKRVVKRGDVVQGYNHQTMSWFTGPGHFLVRACKGDLGDEIAFDYTDIPKDIPAEFPPLQRNDSGISTFVYGNMIDYLRAITPKLLVGQARRHGKITGDYFMLVRR